MSLSLPIFDKAWLAVHVKPRTEKSVGYILENKGYEKFIPTIRRRSAKTADSERPLFPGYVFCRSGSDVLGRIVTTPGVIRILAFGNVPAVIADTEIEALRAIVNSGLPVGPCPNFRDGDLIQICEGPLRGVQGIIMGAGSGSLLIVSVDLLQRSIAVEISQYSVIRIESRAPQGELQTCHIRPPRSGSSGAVMKTAEKQQLVIKDPYGHQ